MSPAKKWWKEVVVYQIYPRSFLDTNGDGIGDLQGIIQKLDYLLELGIDVIWICPVYKSPHDDYGYDISDYQDIHHEFGTMADFDLLLAECHRRGMKLVIDLVINHTSDEHPWFLESRSSKNNAKRDWYIWRDGKNQKEPNNWESIFGGSIWQFDKTTEQFFLHVFSTRQPDLNWENKSMREAVYAMIRWWIAKGIDGFRIDAISHMKKEPTFADLPNPKNLKFVPSYEKHMNVPGIQQYLTDLCEHTFAKTEIMTIGEANGVTVREAEQWVGEGQKKLNMLFQFEHLKLWNQDPDARIEIMQLKEVLSRWQNGLEGKGWNALFVENHDIPRVVSKWGDPENFWYESATCIAAVYFLMKGTPFIYQGQEIGMTNTVFSGPEDFQDVSAHNHFKIRRAEGAKDPQITQELASTARDNARTPMQWNKQKNSGFSQGTPWLKVNPNYPQINVEAQATDAKSILSFYKALIQLRKSFQTLIYGKYELCLAEHPQIYAYIRNGQSEKILVLCNLTKQPAEFTLPQFTVRTRLMGNYFDTRSQEVSSGLLQHGKLRAYECQVYFLGS